MKLTDIIKTKKQMEDMGYNVATNLIEKVNIKAIAHFGNVTCFEIMCSDICPMGGYNNIRNIGYLIKAFIELFELSREDGLRLTGIKNIPCRLIFEDSLESRCIGIGHFMKDKFVLIKEFTRLDE